MKKNFVKKLALGLALVMTVGSVNMPVAAEAASEPGFKSTAVKLEVGQTKKYGTNHYKKWSVKKFVIGNKSVATISYTKGSKSVKVTGVAEGTTKLRADFKAYKSKREVSARIPVTVVAASAVEETPVVTTAELASVKQTASNAFELTFTADASALVNAENLKIESADELYTSYVDDITFSVDGKSAIVTVYGNFVDKAVYNVTYAEKTASFTASVGDVVTVVVNTVQAQENVATDIKFALIDANGMDVTAAKDVETFVTIEAEGDYADSEFANPEEATITMNNVGDKATVTVTYDEYDGKDPVVGKGTVVCVSAQATVGNTTVFTMETTYATPKIYLNSFAPTTTLYEGYNSIPYYFTALDAEGNAIEYDFYEIESSNEDVVAVTEGNDLSGKYASMSIDAVGAGTAKVIITATKNEKETVYYGTVRVLEEARLNTITLDKSSVSLSTNANHVNDYVKVTAKDQYGAAYTDATITVEMNDEDLAKYNSVFGYTATTGRYGNKISIDGTALVEDSYVVKVTVSDNNNDKELVKKFTVKAKKPSSVTDLTYKIELSSASLDMNPEYQGAYETLTARVAGYAGNVFVKYVTDFETTVTKGNKEFGNALNAGAVSGASITYEADGFTLTTVADADSDGIIDLVVSDDLKDIAETGTYKIKVVIDAGKKLTKTATFTVKNSMEMPTVKVDKTTSKEAGLLDVVRDCVTVDVAVLAADETCVVGGVDKDYGTSGVTKTGTSTTKHVVKYVVVSDTFVSGNSARTYNYYVPVNKTFTEK